jgi:UPF0176 protein
MTEAVSVVSFYRFMDIADPGALRERLLAFANSRDLLGTILVAREGFNGTVAGTAGAVRALLGFIAAELLIDGDIDARWTEAGEAPFRRLRVVSKKEIVALGRPDIHPHRGTGKHLDPDEWNRLIAEPDVLVIDTRNHYEYEVGTFENAVDPGTRSFRDFPAYAKRLARENPDRRLAMFCTGGIRCEKATALMMELGFSEVFQLRGGILSYLSQVADEDNKWHGECFVFDSRVAVDRDLAEGGYVQCHACRRPLSKADLDSPDYREGVSCPHCVHAIDRQRQERLEERRKQVALAKERGTKHIGATQDRRGKSG